MNEVDEIERFRQIWEKIRIGNRLNVCSESLKGCSVMDVNILRLAYSKPQITPKEVIKLLGIPNSTLTNAVNRLSKKGLLMRTLNSSDYRSLQITLTESGRKAILDHREGERAVIRNIFSALNESEVSSMLNILEKISQMAGAD